MINKIEKINLLIINIGVVVLGCLIIYTGLYSLLIKDYTALGDPYHTNQILAFRRAPYIITTTLITLLFVFMEFIILIIKKCLKSSK